MTGGCVVVAADADPLTQRAAALLAGRAGRRLGRPVPVVAEATGQDGTPAVRIGTGPVDPAAPDSYTIASDAQGSAQITAADGRGAIFAAGELLRASHFTGGTWTLPDLSVARSPVKAQRPIYFATHFGNWYCHASLDELGEYIEDLALAGYNELVTWFDLHHFRDLDDGAAVWDRLSALDELARAVGMRIGRIAIANESFAEQAPPELRAIGRLEGTGYDTDLCPSKPEARAIILEDRRLVFEKLRATTTIDWVCLWPYDQGGCNCEACAPWPHTYVDLCREIAALGAEILPETRMVLSAWWIGTHVAGEDEALFDALRTGERWFDTVMAGTVELRRWLADGRQVPDPYDVLLFPEISMFDATPWGGRGANPAPRKFGAEMDELGPHIAGAMPYSEGRYEDFNKFLWARLQWDPAQPVAEIAEEYCRAFFGAEVAPDAAALVADMERGLADLTTAVRRDQAASIIEERMALWARGGWRWQMLRARTSIDALRRRLEDPTTSEAERLAARAALQQVYEYLQRDLNLHDPERSLHFWIHLPFEEWLDVPFNQYVLPTGGS